MLSMQLLNNLAATPHLSRILRVQPALPLKMHRPYLAATLTTQQVVDALSQHYHYLAADCPSAMYDACLSASGFTLVRIAGKNDESYVIKMRSMDKLNKEGEVSLLFETEDGTMLGSTTFSIFQFRQRKTLFIGGMQGAKQETPHQAIQQATKGCQGLFPKRLLIEAICRLALRMKVEQIIAVGNSTHIYQNWRYHYKKKDQLFADYDAFWQSLDGERIDGDYFRLPDHITRKDLEEIASKKRAEYRRRYLLLDRLEDEIDNHFS